MRILKSSKENILSKDEFLNIISNYEKLIMDLGTGQGAFVYFNAIDNKDNFYIGLDASMDSMKKYSIKKYKNKVENLMYVVMNAQNIDEVLFNRFSEVYVNLPWGSLLQGIFKEDLKIIENISKMLIPNGELHICFSYDERFEEEEIRKRGLPNIGEEYFKNEFIPLYEKYNIDINSIDIVKNNDLSFESKWMKVLSERSIREFYVIEGKKRA